MSEKNKYAAYSQVGKGSAAAATKPPKSKLVGKGLTNRQKKRRNMNKRIMQQPTPQTRFQPPIRQWSGVWKD